MKVRPELARSLTANRALSEATRESWRRTLIYQQIEDLNASFDRIDVRGRAHADEIRQVAAVARRIVRGARLVRATALGAAWAFAKEELDRPEDAFGPAVLLLGLDGESADVRAWADGLPSNVARGLKQLAAAES